MREDFWEVGDSAITISEKDIRSAHSIRLLQIHVSISATKCEYLRVIRMDESFV